MLARCGIVGGCRSCLLLLHLQVEVDARSPVGSRVLAQPLHARPPARRNGCSIAVGSRENERVPPSGHQEGRNGCSIAVGSRAGRHQRDPRLSPRQKWMLDRCGIERSSTPSAESRQLVHIVGMDAPRSLWDREASSAMTPRAMTSSSKWMLDRCGIERRHSCGTPCRRLLVEMDARSLWDREVRARSKRAGRAWSRNGCSIAVGSRGHGALAGRDARARVRNQRMLDRCGIERACRARPASA